MIMEMDKAHELANIIAEAEALGIFEAMDKRTREDIDNAHETAKVSRRQEIGELRVDADRLMDAADRATNPEPLREKARAWLKRADELEAGS